MAPNGRDPRVPAIDAGGTMTDTFISDAGGEFVVGKAQTTPAIPRGRTARMDGHRIWHLSLGYVGGASSSWSSGALDLP